MHRDLEHVEPGNGQFEGRSGIRISAFKLAISGIPESWDPRIPDSGFWNSGILEFWISEFRIRILEFWNSGTP